MLKTIGKAILRIIMICIFLVIMITSAVALDFAYIRYGKNLNGNKNNSLMNLLQNNIIKEKVYVLVTGTNDTLTDFIAVVGYNPATGDISILSIPRDTKYTGKNGRDTAFSKINAIYQGKHIDKLQAEIEKMLDIKIDYYVVFDHKALWEVVDAIGGVTVNVERDMKYSDPAQKLYINLKKGVQKLNGKQAEQYVRYRKGYSNGDIGRISAQQNFIKSFIAECVKPANIGKLPNAAKIGFQYIKTNVTMDTVLSYIEDVAKIDMAKIRMETLPGYPQTMSGVSFYIMNEKEIKELSKEMFKWEKSETTNTASSEEK